MRNCGYESGKELNNLINSIADLSLEEQSNNKENLISFSKVASFFKTFF